MMKTMRPLVLLFALFAASTTTLAGTFCTGNDLVVGWREHQKLVSKTHGDTMEASKFLAYIEAARFTAYVIGVSDALDNLSFAIPVNATKNQLCTVVGRYLDAHPERWTEVGSDIVIAALKAAFPKR